MSEYIKKEQALKAMKNFERQCKTPMECVIAARAYNAILSIPAADAAPVAHAKWKWLGPCYDDRGNLWGTCSACKERQRLGDYWTFCPNCGAKMDGGENNG